MWIIPRTILLYCLFKGPFYFISPKGLFHFTLLFKDLCSFIILFFFSFTAISDYRQSLQFQNLNEEKRNIHLEVCFHGTSCCVFHFVSFFSNPPLYG